MLIYWGKKVNEFLGKKQLFCMNEADSILAGVSVILG